MKFVRVGCLEFDRIRECDPTVAFRYDERVEVNVSRLHAPDAPTNSFPIYGALGFSTLDAAAMRDGRLTIDESMRRHCEAAIEAVADAVAIANKCARRILSALPFYFLVPESGEDQAALASLVDFPRGWRSRPQVLIATGLDLGHLLNVLRDRPVGAALLAEAVGNSSPMGRYRDFVRLFESAFSLNPHDVGAQLTSHLAGANMGYTRAEVQGWLNLRDAASHADMSEQPNVALERDIQPFIFRMEQAATDVLFNKNIWGERRPTRRNVWIPTTATVSASGDLRMTQGVPTAIDVGAGMDCFNAWPMHRSINMDTPPGWWRPNAPGFVPG